MQEQFWSSCQRSAPPQPGKARQKREAQDKRNCPDQLCRWKIKEITTLWITWLAKQLQYQKKYSQNQSGRPFSTSWLVWSSCRLPCNYEKQDRNSAHWSERIFWRTHKDFNMYCMMYISSCCRFGLWICKCNYKCLTKRRGLAMNNFLRFEQSLNLGWIHAFYRPISEPCLYMYVFIWTICSLKEDKSFHNLFIV